MVLFRAASVPRVLTITSATIAAAVLLGGCEIQGSDNLPRVPDQGLVMYAEANWHEAEDTAEVVAAVFDDGVAVNLVGGDVFEARTATERVLLTKRGFFAGSYAESLSVDNSIQDVFFNVVHEPIAARENRWYPVDLIGTDPGPGELVGKSASVSFPLAVTITAPATDTVYHSINDVIGLSWISGNGDDMRVLAAVNCTDGLATSSYGVVIDKEVIAGMDVDDGDEGIPMNRIIYDLNQGSGTIEFVRDATLMLLQELLNQLSAGNIDPDFLLKQREANPIESTCNIRMFLQRQLDGQFDTTFDAGTVIGSTSAEITVQYLPPVPL
ncbi:MAG: hypothetical protein JSW45_08665 [Thiotrichales bacterium]|nr:MAG: hypothetical protein JSW45_08665 [Thiotrichales bacterium]